MRPKLKKNLLFMGLIGIHLKDIYKGDILSKSTVKATPRNRWENITRWATPVIAGTRISVRQPQYKIFENINW